MILRRLGHAPCGGFRMISLEVFEDYLRVFDVLAAPERLWKQYPVQRLPRALFECVCEKRLRMPNESDFAASETQALPKQAHEPVALRSARGIAVTAGSQDHARGSRGFSRNAASDLIGERFH